MSVRKRKLSESVKKEVAHRQKYCCYKCLQMLPPTFQTDHIIPHSISNDDSIDNLQVLCPNCHSLKTQKENSRIIKFKYLLSKCPKNTNLCWFCLESTDNMKNHLKSCSKILKDINIKNNVKRNISSSFDEMLVTHLNTNNDSITAVNDDFENMKISNENSVFDNDFKNMKISNESSIDISNILLIEIRLHDLTILVNNKYKYKILNDDILPQDVGEAVFFGTRSKKYSKKIDTIEIIISDEEIERDEEDKNACCDYLCDVLLKYIPERLLKNDTEVIFIT